MDLWFADSEVFAHDYLWVFKRQSDGRIEAFWNDCDGVEDFIYREKPVLCGFNFRDYDSYILKATLLGWEPERIHEVSWGCITFDDRNMVWSMFQGEPWVELPPIIDLFHDIVPRKGLKEIEGNIGLSIEESTVSFDIDRPLTSEEQDEVLAYCIHDVNATEKLYDLRYDYVKSKSDLCELQGIDPLTMLKHTNARIVSEVLRAEKLPYDAIHGTIEHYEVPDNVDRTAIPPEVLTYVEGVNTRNCEGEYGEIEFMFHGCPTKVALGGIHAAIPKYMETATNDRVILIQDIGSYYPSLIINNGYMSRAVSDPSVYKQFYDMRMEAKAKGDKATADAAKLVLNTTFGVMKDWYNKMYDPMQGTRVCLSGQLYIIDLITQIFRVTATAQLIQLNTDGWVISVDKSEIVALDEAVALWQKRTGFTVDTNFIERIVQANVNNYVLRTTDGKIKTKGIVVARYNGGDFKSNSMTVIDKAVVDYVLDGVPIAQTIEACDDIERFQIIAKAGQTFQKVVHQRLTYHGEQQAMGRRKPKPIITATESDVQRVNRVYATADKSYGGIYKVKLDDGVEVGRSRIPLTPDHCIIDNKNELRQMLTTLDKGWYIDLAHRKVKEFTTRTREEKEQMAETKEPHNELDGGDAAKSTPTRKAATKKSGESTVPFMQKLLALQVAMSGASTGVTFDGVVSNISYEYADTQQYKAWLNEKCSAIGLIFKLDLECSFPEPFNTKNGVSFGSMATGTASFIDAETGEAMVYHLSGFGINVQAGYCVGAAQTNALRNFILNNFLLDNKGREGDDVASAATTEVGGKFGGGYVSPEEKTQMKQGIADAKGEENKFATDIFANALYPKLMEAREVEGYETKFSKLLAKHFNEDGTPNGTPIPKKDAVAAMNLAEEIIAEGAGE